MSNKDTQMKYFLNDSDYPFAKDEQDNEYYVTKKGFVSTDKGTIDPMWSGCTKEEAEKNAWN